MKKRLNMPLITKEYKFCAAHKYWNKNWSDKKNNEVFGEDVRNHGHNYVLRITVKGEINTESGFLVDLGWLNNIIKKEIINILDHSQIDEDIPWFKDKSPSTENLVIFMWEKIHPYFAEKDFHLHKIFIRETPTIFTEYYGPEDE
tara:strand:- start:67 stop:501 length:435 start_codon:yes stop_codon:yes gene_type:complete